MHQPTSYIWFGVWSAEALCIFCVCFILDPGILTILPERLSYIIAPKEVKFSLITKGHPFFLQCLASMASKLFGNGLLWCQVLFRLYRLRNNKIWNIQKGICIPSLQYQTRVEVLICTHRHFLRRNHTLKSVTLYFLYSTKCAYAKFVQLKTKELRTLRG